MSGKQTNADFFQAVGESFSDSVSPPVPFDLATSHECFEVLLLVVGKSITPSVLAKLNEDTIKILAEEFGRYFECEAPSFEQVQTAIELSLFRWPVGSLGKSG